MLQMNPELSSIYSQEEKVRNDHNQSDNKDNKGKKDEKPDLTLQLHVANNLIPSINNSSDLQNFLSKVKNKEWFNKILIDSTIYYNNDKLLWGPFLIIIFKDPDTKNISSVILDKLGLTVLPCIDITNNSKYYPAIENLPQDKQQSNVRRALAVSLLQKFTQLTNDQIQVIAPKYPLKFDYDQTYSGELGSKCQIFTSLIPERLGKKLKEIGVFSSNRSIKSILLDVVYENNETYIDANNKLVFHLGEQLEQLFNPITEYSPEQTEYNYKPPDDESSIENDGPLVKAIINEFLQFQSNFTYNLVDFLQKVLITLRVRVLNNEIDGLSTTKLNRLFPPTIDEVTRINCIFLDSLKAAAPYGSLEVLKACSLTIPYFYKAYTRHEAATKNFSKDIKLFLRNFHDILPENNTYTELKLETIIKGPQEKLIKLKLIIDRLYQNKKKWSSDKNKILAEKEYTNVIDVIDSFGKLDKPLSSYDTRVFTPSGKILTELAKGWPVELQYKWLKRRVVGVYDIIETSKSNNRSILVIFSDYVVFLSIIDFEKYYTSDGIHKPFISDILMNSLINEIPLPPKIPKLKVDKYSYIDNVFVSVYDETFLRFDSVKGDNSFSITCQLANPKSISVSYISDLITKAKILEKDTAFHLFKAVKNDITMYSTAHELDAYNNERIKSPFALVLNIKPNPSFLIKHKLQLAIFAEFINKNETEEIVKFTILSADKGKLTMEHPSNGIVSEIVQNISKHVISYYSSIKSPYIKDLMNCNISLLNNIKNITDDPLSTNSDNSSQKFILQQVNSENKQSYGTITTFRSHKSDLKDTASEEKHEKNKIPSSTKTKHMIQKTTVKKPTPPVKKEINKINNKPTPSVAYSNKEKKTKFFGVLKNIFGKSKPKAKKTKISKPIAVNNHRLNNKGNQNVTAIPTPKSMKKIQTPAKGNRLSNINLPSLTEKPTTEEKDKKDVDSGISIETSVKLQNEGSTSQARIPSVVRNTDFVKNIELIVNEVESNLITDDSNENTDYKDPKTTDNKYQNKINLAKQNKDENTKKGNTTNKEPIIPTDNQNTIRISEGSVSSNHNKSIKNDEMLSKALQKNTNDSINNNHSTNSGKESSELDTTEISHSTIKTRDIVNKGLIGDISTQSQVFNNDLFGDFIEDIPTIKKKTYNTKPVTSQEESICNKDTNDNNNNAKVSTIISTPVVSVSSSRSVSTVKNQEPENTTFNTTTETKNVIGDSEPTADSNTPTTELKENSTNNDSNKFQAFPQLPNIKISKPFISFERSPSFIELFQGMRMVLDENDAKYNWKRIPSISSLNNELLLDPNEQKHKMESVPEEPSENYNDSSLIGNLQQFATTTLGNSFTTPKNINEDAKGILEIQEDSKDSVIIESLDKSVTKMVESMFSESTPTLKPKGPSPFKVLHSSPPRYVNQTVVQDTDKIINNATSPSKNIDTVISTDKVPLNRFFNKNTNITSDFSFPSEIVPGPDKRWLELSFASQEDLKGIYNPSVESLDNKPYLTPSEEPEDVFNKIHNSNQMDTTIERDTTLEAPEDTTIGKSFNNNSINNTSVQSSNVDDTPTKQFLNNNTDLHDIISSKNGNKQTLDSSKMNNSCSDTAHSLLADLEFSSFNMTFNSTTNNSVFDNSNKNVLVQEDKNTSEDSVISNIWKEAPKLEQKDKVPVVYRLTRDLMSGISPINNKGHGNSSKLLGKPNEEDPIWVSPSKLDFAVSPHKNKTETNNENSVTNNTIIHETSSKSKNDDLVKDSSFAFLADIISGSNLGNSTIFDQDTSDISSESDVDYQNDKPEKLNFIK